MYSGFKVYISSRQVSRKKKVGYLKQLPLSIFYFACNIKMFIAQAKTVITAGI